MDTELFELIRRYGKASFDAGQFINIDSYRYLLYSQEQDNLLGAIKERLQPAVEPDAEKRTG